MYGPNGLHPVIVKLLALVEHDPLAVPPDVTQVALQLHVSESHFRHLIRRDFGVNYTKWLRGRRVEMVRRMMIANPQMTISDIAAQCGYFDLGQLYRHFMMELSAGPTVVRSRDAAGPSTPLRRTLTERNVGATSIATMSGRKLPVSRP
jgi:AraC-like DNA-binding protein